MRCPRCGAVGVDAQGLCLRCRLFIGVPAGPPPTQRNPLLIPGLIFGVVAVLLLGAVIVYAVTSGASPGTDSEAGPSRPAVVAPTGTPVPAQTPAATPGATGSSGPPASAGPSAGPSSSTDTCIRGVWLEEQHDEQVTILNTGVFPFRGSGAFHRYNDSGRVVIDYGSGVRLTGANGSTTYEFLYTGFLSYTYQVTGGQVVYSNPRADGTETLFRNGTKDYSTALTPHDIAPMRLNCGSVALGLTNSAVTLQLKRTSPRQ